MLGVTLAAAHTVPSPWPKGSAFGVDFRSGRAMRNGTWLPLTQAMTFSRASSRLAQAQDGAWRSFAPDQPAITALGLSLEPESTNLLVNNTGHSGAGILLTGATLAPAGIDSPARDTHAKRLSHGNATSDGLTRHSLQVTGGQLYSWSQSFRFDGAATWVRFAFSDNVAHGLSAWLNLETMTLGTSGVFGNAVMQSCTLTPEIHGWHRLAMSGILPNSANGSLATYAAPANGNVARHAGTFLLWAPQMESGAPSSPILTGATPAQRSGDILTLHLPPTAQTLHLAERDNTSSLAVTGGNHALAASPARMLTKIWAIPA